MHEPPSPSGVPAAIIDTSTSRINLAERFFCLISSDAICRRVARRVAELKTAIETYLEQHNAEPALRPPKPPIILEKVARRVTRVSVFAPQPSGG